ncbi:MAG TPA: hypothetical protein VHZ32_17550, partial [Rhizomicrobium sp.]|nr:hypothetical protein [Rhizomicrobium sp.]
MRRPVLAAFALVPAAAVMMIQAGLFSSSVPAAAQPSTTAAHACDSHCDAGWMDANLRLDQIQVVGTAESYKQKPDGAIMAL